MTQQPSPGMPALTEQRFYFLVECPACDEDIHYGPVMSLLEHRGLMVVPFDMMAQTRVDCDHCDATVYFGDFDDYIVERDGEEVDV